MGEEIVFPTSNKFELVNITHQVERIVSKSGVRDGVCVVYAPHATAGIIINESADPEIAQDILEQLEQLVPSNKVYRHDRIDDNAQAHIKAALVSPSQSIPIINGRLALGTWQSIFFCEFDGPRTRRKVIVKVIKS